MELVYVQLKSLENREHMYVLLIVLMLHLFNILNLSLQKKLNPPSPYSKEIKVGYRVFREHDKVLQLKNLPDEDVYNGDIGIIKCDICGDYV